jgi:hypothetical protein
MTEFEILEATFGANAAMHNAFQYWISITFALILTARLAQRQLNRVMVVTVGVLYFACALFFFIDYLHWLGVILNLEVVPLVDVGWSAGAVKTYFRIGLFAVGTLTAEAYLIFSYVTKGQESRNC